MQIFDSESLKNPKQEASAYIGMIDVTNSIIDAWKI